MADRNNADVRGRAGYGYQPNTGKIVDAYHGRILVLKNVQNLRNLLQQANANTAKANAIAKGAERSEMIALGTLAGAALVAGGFYAAKRITRSRAARLAGGKGSGSGGAGRG